MRLNRSDRRVLLTLFLVVLALWGGFLLGGWWATSRSELVELDEAGMDSLEAVWGGADTSAVQASSGYYAVPVVEPETFPFDPNTADSTALLRLGLAPWQVRAIYKYRAHGGRYHRAEDFQRLPGMTPELWQRLAPAVRIGEAFRYYDREALEHHRPTGTAPSSSPADTVASAPSAYPRQEKFTELVRLDLNAVDSFDLKKVPGIASYRARQILRYRDRLGGFVSVEQLGEIEGLPVELQAWFSVETGILRPLNLNTASVGELARHPYLGSSRARAIASYRRSNGRLQSLSELSLLTEFPADVLARLEPYVTF